MTPEYKQESANSQEEFFAAMKFAVTVTVVRSSLADRLREVAAGTPQKVIVARSGIGSDQVSKILSGETKDPRWSTMVSLLREGLGVSLDEFAGGSASSPLTPYDTTPEYRELVDLLERIPKRERSRAIETVSWLLLPRSVAAKAEVLSFVPYRESAHKMSEDELKRAVSAYASVIEYRRGVRMQEHEVPYIGAVSAGKGIEVFEAADQKVRAIPEYYWNRGVRAVVKAVGSSMLDMGITDNDLLYVIPGKAPRNGDVVIATVNGAAFVKQLARDESGRPRLVSRSEGYPDVEIGEQDDVRFFGVVVGRTGDFSGEETPQRRADRSKIPHESDDGPGLMPGDLNRHG